MLVFFILPIIAFGLVTMKGFTPLEDTGLFFSKQLVWILVGFTIFFVFAFIDFRFLKRTDVLVTIFLFNSFVLILPFILVLLQPDFGSAMIIFFIWLGMVLVSGISKIHLLLIFTSSLVIFTFLWFLVFAPYQKARISNFINPLADVHGSGYNAFQATIAVGGGEITGKGLGFGTQSRLKFLQQPQSDFIFAAYAEEWGLIGSILILLLYGLVIWGILYSATLGSSNFEILFGMGIAIFFMSHILINIGMNLGLMPVTGIPLPFMSYGGSHLLTEFAGLGILMSMKRYGRALHRDDTKNEFLGA